MDDWLTHLPLLPKSKARLGHPSGWPEMLALQMFDRAASWDPKTHGRALAVVHSVLDPRTISEDIAHVRVSPPLPISERDQEVFLAAIQWLGTNVGRNFLENYLEELKKEFKQRRAAP